MSIEKATVYNSLKRISNLISAIGSCWYFHYEPSRNTSYLVSVINSGSHGVQLFYILSAFTLFYSYNHRKNEEKPIRNYFIRRFFRIAPLYYVAIIYFLWQDGMGSRYWLGSETHITTDNIVSNFLFLHGFNPYWINSLVQGGWSVAIEVIFYCFLPVLFFNIKNIKQALTFLIIALLIRLAFNITLTHFRLISDKELWSNYLYLYLPNQLPVFSFGIILYFFIYDDKSKEIPSKLLFSCASILIIGLSVGYNLITYDLLYWSAAFFILAYSLHRYHPKILFNKLILHIGNISYSMYLSQFAVLYWLNKLSLLNIFKSTPKIPPIANFFINYGFVILCSIAISSILHYLIELPFQKIGKRVISLM